MFELSFNQITLPKANRYLVLVTTNQLTVFTLLFREELKLVLNGPLILTFLLFN